MSENAPGGPSPGKPMAAAGAAETGDRPRGPYGERYQLVATSQEQEDAFDLQAKRSEAAGDGKLLSGVINSAANLVKGALGAGVLCGHVAYKAGGFWVCAPLNAALGLYLTYCLWILGLSAQTIARRTQILRLSYPEVGEAAMACHPSPVMKRLSRFFRVAIDCIICLDLFGCCACYQLVIAKTAKQLVENTAGTKVAAQIPGYPNLRVYLAIFLIPCACISLIRHLEVLAPFSIVGNILVVLCVVVTMYYCFVNNPTLSGMKPATTFKGAFQFLGMIVFSMSCSGVVLAVENNMREPKKFSLALWSGMAIILVAIMAEATFGYAGYLEESQEPITMNFPMEILPKILKGLIAVMITITHAVNYWVPFNLAFHYLKKLHRPERHVLFEYIYRALISATITCLAIIFPDISKLMGFLGAFCVSNMAFIWPVTIYLLVVWERPGLGPYKWRLWMSIFLLIIGLILWISGSLVSISELASLFGASDEKIDEIDD